MIASRMTRIASLKSKIQNPELACGVWGCLLIEEPGPGPVGIPVVPVYRCRYRHRDRDRYRYK